MKRILIASALLLQAIAAASAQTSLALPTLRASVSVSGEVVRIGDFVENAGEMAPVAVFRAPDLGTTGLVPVAQVLEALRSHNVIGVSTGDIRDVAVTREARTLTQKDIEAEVTRALERRNGLGDAANIALTFDRDVRVLQLDASHRGNLTLLAARYEPRFTRFDVTFELAREHGATPTRLRFTGTAIETIEAAVLTRSVERGEILRSSDVIVERRPKTEAGLDPAPRERAIGMQMRKGVRTGQPLRMTDLAKADLVTRDQNVSLVYEAPGIYLTMRAKALDAGSEGDTISVMNLQSKRVVQGVVTGPGQVSMSAPSPRLTASLTATPPATATPASE